MKVRKEILSSKTVEVEIDEKKIKSMRFAMIERVEIIEPPKLFGDKPDPYVIISIRHDGVLVKIKVSILDLQAALHPEAEIPGAKYSFADSINRRMKENVKGTIQK